LIFPQPAGANNIKSRSEGDTEKVVSRRTDKEAGRIIETSGGGDISLITGNSYISPVSSGAAVQDCGGVLLCVNHFSGEKGGSIGTNQIVTGESFKHLKI